MNTPNPYQPPSGASSDPISAGQVADAKRLENFARLSWALPVIAFGFPVVIQGGLDLAGYYQSGYFGLWILIIGTIAGVGFSIWTLAMSRKQKQLLTHAVLGAFVNGTMISILIFFAS